MDFREKFVVRPGEKVQLSKIDPSYTGEHETHEKAIPEITKHTQRMQKLQYPADIGRPCLLTDPRKFVRVLP